MKRPALRWARDTSGATAIEYGMIVLLIAMVVVVTLPQLGAALSNFLTPVIAAL